MNIKWPRGLVVDDVIKEIIAAIEYQTRCLFDCYRDNVIKHPTEAIVRLCQLLNQTVESAELREKLHEIDNELREKLREILPDWKYNPNSDKD
jgi:hypothetical protein